MESRNSSSVQVGWNPAKASAMNVVFGYTFQDGNDNRRPNNVLRDKDTAYLIIENSKFRWLDFAIVVALGLFFFAWLHATYGMEGEEGYAQIQKDGR